MGKKVSTICVKAPLKLDVKDGNFVIAFEDEDTYMTLRINNHADVERIKKFVEYAYNKGYDKCYQLFLKDAKSLSEDDR
jgi:uncharacterized membrane protein